MSDVDININNFNDGIFYRLRKCIYVILGTV